MKPHRLLLTGAVLSAIGAAFGYHHLSISDKPPASISVADHAPAQSSYSPKAPTAASENSAPMVSTGESGQAQALSELLDQVIADAIQRGTIDLNRLTPQQLALLPDKFRKKTNSGEPQLSADEIAHIEQQIALGDDAPPDPPPQLPCPDPNHLPENYDNDYNKMVLRERGCKI